MTTLEYARYYLSKGFSVIPIAPKSKFPDPILPIKTNAEGDPVINKATGKPERTWEPYKHRYATEQELTNWFGNGSRRNIGIVTGSLSNLAVADLDSERAVQFAKDNHFPVTPLVRTARGFQPYYRFKDGVRNFQKRDDLPDIDLRGDGGYVVAPPSTHPSGRPYEWVEGKSLEDVPFAELPDIILAKSQQDKTPLKELYNGVSEGQRNDTLARLVGSWVNDDLSLGQCLEMAYLWNEKNDPPLTERREIERTVRSIFEKHHREKRSERNATSEGTNGEHPGLKVVTIEELLSLDFPPRENIVDPWLPVQGLGMIFGYRGLGKTFLALSLAVSAASGSKFLKWSCPRPRGLLYIDGEMPAVVLQERLARIIDSSDSEVSAPLLVLTPDVQKYGIPDLSTHLGQAAIEPFLGEVSTIIVDNISTLCRTGRENEGESWLPVQEWALNLRSRGYSVLFIHHPGKGGQQRGTSRREDVLDTVINLKRPADYEASDGARFELHFEKARAVYGDELKPLDIRLTCDEKGKLIWSMKDLELTLTEKVAELLNEGIQQQDIAEILGVSKGTVSKHKSKAKEMGLLKGTGK